MQLIILIIFIGLLIGGCKTKTNEHRKKIAILYIIEIGTILLISTFNPYGLFEVSNYTYMLWIICTLSFAIPFLILFRKKTNNIENDKKIDIDKVVSSKIINGLFIINLAIVIFYKIKYEIITKDLPIYEVRIARFEDLLGSAFENLFFNYIVVGLVSVAAIIFAVLLVNKKIKNALFWICGITIIIYSLIGYGRMMFLNIIIYIITTLLMTYDLKDLINKKNIFKLFIAIIAFLLIFTSMLYVRTYNKNLTFTENIANTINAQARQIITYVTGGLRMLDNYISNGFEGITGHTYGRATLAGFEEILLYPLKGIGLEINSYNNLIADVAQKSTVIGENNLKFNAFYTSVMNFYSDFGIAGVIIFPILYALLMIWIFNNFNKRRTFSSLLLLNYSVMILIFSIIRWNLQIGSNTFILLVLILMNLYSIWKEKNNGSSETTSKIDKKNAV